MHRGELAADCVPAKALVILDLVGIAGFGRRLTAGEVVESPLELVERPGPGVALVADEGLARPPSA
jgi:hypothetical protein